MSVFANINFCIQQGDDYMNFANFLTDLGYEDRSTYEAVYVVTDDDDDQYPRIFFGRREASLDVRGLIYDSGVPETFEDASGTGLFAIMDPELAVLGPVGFIELDNTSRIDQNGVILLSGQIPAQRDSLLTVWGYGDLLPQRFNNNNAHSSAGYFKAPVGAIGVINVVKRGGLTALELRYTISSTTYRLAADIDSSRVNPQLKVGRLMNGANAIPSESNGTWRINLTGSQTGMEIYVGVIR